MTTKKFTSEDIEEAIEDLTHLRKRYENDLVEPREIFSAALPLAKIVKQLQAENAELWSEVNAHRASIIDECLKSAGRPVTREEFVRIINDEEKDA